MHAVYIESYHLLQTPVTQLIAGILWRKLVSNKNELKQVFTEPSWDFGTFYNTIFNKIK